MTNVESLKNLYLALGGSAEDLSGIDSNAAVINLLAGAAGEITGSLIINAKVSGDTTTLDKTYKQIRDAMRAGKNVVVVSTDSTSETYTTIASMVETPGSSEFIVQTGALVFSTDSEDGYPSSTST